MRRLALLLLAIPAACGGGTQGASDGGASDAPATTYDAAPPDASPPDAPTPPDAAAPPDAALPRFGTVIIGNNPYDMGTFGTAVFRPEPYYGVPFATFGSCAYYPVAPPLESGWSAGIVDVTREGGGAISLVPSGVAPEVTYWAMTSVPDGYFYDPFGTLTASAAGADFPAFTLSASMPPAIADVGPVGAFSRSADKTITWLAGGANYVMALDVYTYHLGIVEFHLMHCDAADDGTFTIPHQILKFAPSTDDGVYLQIWRRRVDTVTIGDATADLWLETGVSDAESLDP